MLGTVVCIMRGVCESSFEVVRRVHLKLSKGRGLAGVGEREALEQAAGNLSI